MLLIYGIQDMVIFQAQELIQQTCTQNQVSKGTEKQKKKIVNNSRKIKLKQ
jgi:hypothetical protein